MGSEYALNTPTRMYAYAQSPSKKPQRALKVHPTVHAVSVQDKYADHLIACQQGLNAKDYLAPNMATTTEDLAPI